MLVWGWSLFPSKPPNSILPRFGKVRGGGAVCAGGVPKDLSRVNLHPDDLEGGQLPLPRNPSFARRCRPMVGSARTRNARGMKPAMRNRDHAARTNSRQANIAEVLKFFVSVLLGSYPLIPDWMVPCRNAGTNEFLIGLAAGKKPLPPRAPCRPLPSLRGCRPRNAPGTRPRPSSRAALISPLWDCGIAWCRVPVPPSPRLAPPETMFPVARGRQAVVGPPVTKRFPHPSGA